MKKKGEYKYFQTGVSLGAIQLVDKQIKLDMTLDGIKVNGWEIQPLTEPMVSSGDC